MRVGTSARLSAAAVPIPIDKVNSVQEKLVKYLGVVGKYCFLTVVGRT
jgi:hypothetical protein